MKLKTLSTLVATGLALSAVSLSTNAAGRLVVYCSATNAMCEAETKPLPKNMMLKRPLFVMVQGVL